MLSAYYDQALLTPLGGMNSWRGGDLGQLQPHDNEAPAEAPAEERANRDPGGFPFVLTSDLIYSTGACPAAGTPQKKTYSIACVFYAEVRMSGCSRRAWSKYAAAHV